MSAFSPGQMVPVGFFAKRLRGNDGWLPSHVHEICSVSRCMATVPDDWILSWQHNKYFFFDSEAIACEIASSLAPDFDVFAYRVLPRRFDKIGETEITIDKLVDGAIVVLANDADLSAALDAKYRALREIETDVVPTTK